MVFHNTRSFAQELDRTDPLRHFRDRFFIPEREGNALIYFCGNSLGLQPKAVREAADAELTTWQHLGVEGWFDGETPWLSYHRTCKEALGQIVGAEPVEVCPMNALTVNLHLLLASFYRPTPTKYKILTIAGDFPSDQYALETHAAFRSYPPADAIIEVSPRTDGLIHTSDIQRAIAEHCDSLALIWLSGLNYYTGQVYNMAVIAETARHYGIPVGFDLAHAIGNVPLQLHDWGVDFATWCSYKYLNGGPGAISGIFVHQKHHDRNLPRLAGWWGYQEETRFAMTKGFVPMHGADGWQLSTPNIVALAMHRAALSITAEAGMPQLRRKSEQLTGFLEHVLLEAGFGRSDEAGSLPYQILTPADPNQRGCQLSLLVRDNGKALFDRLASGGLIGDWREPNCIRLAPNPLYNTFDEVWQVGEALGRVSIG
ncbi:kynureninase [Fibrisoma montanum]|uniref:Kynureninase n=1 Tax=Fibrisoma montanum TaxID=2305895 RepID=A0A418ME50_9BACT|nr:kynureninase [Fibrisoma montanum]RIV25090.1 kynureninase [Fibrisoma montanum]